MKERRGVVAEEAVEAVADGDAGELLGADVGGAEEGEVTRVKGRVSEEEVVADCEAQNGVAEELEALVGGGGRVGEGGVGECVF